MMYSLTSLSVHIWYCSIAITFWGREGGGRAALLCAYLYIGEGPCNWTYLPGQEKCHYSYFIDSNILFTDITYVVNIRNDY